MSEREERIIHPSYHTLRPFSHSFTVKFSALKSCRNAQSSQRGGRWSVGRKREGKSFVFKSRANTSSKSISWAKLPACVEGDMLCCSTSLLEVVSVATGTFTGADRENGGFLADFLRPLAEHSLQYPNAPSKGSLVEPVAVSCVESAEKKDANHPFCKHCTYRQITGDKVCILGTMEYSQTAIRQSRNHSQENTDCWRCLSLPLRLTRRPQGFVASAV